MRVHCGGATLKAVGLGGASKVLQRDVLRTLPLLLSESEAHYVTDDREIVEMIRRSIKSYKGVVVVTVLPASAAGAEAEADPRFVPASASSAADQAAGRDLLQDYLGGEANGKLELYDWRSALNPYIECAELSKLLTELKAKCRSFTAARRDQLRRCAPLFARTIEATGAPTGSAVLFKGCAAQEQQIRASVQANQLCMLCAMQLEVIAHFRAAVQTELAKPPEELIQHMDTALQQHMNASDAVFQATKSDLVGALHDAAARGGELAGVGGPSFLREIQACEAQMQELGSRLTAHHSGAALAHFAHALSQLEAAVFDEFDAELAKHEVEVVLQGSKNSKGKVTFGLSITDCKVVGFADGSPAEACGMRFGDRLLSCSYADMKKEGELQRAQMLADEHIVCALGAAGEQPIRVRMLRGALKTVQMTAAAHPSSGKPSFGMQITSTQVTQLVEGGAAQRAGVGVADCLLALSVGGKRVAIVEDADVIRALRQAAAQPDPFSAAAMVAVELSTSVPLTAAAHFSGARDLKQLKKKIELETQNFRQLQATLADSLLKQEALSKKKRKKKATKAVGPPELRDIPEGSRSVSSIYHNDPNNFNRSRLSSDKTWAASPPHHVGEWLQMDCGKVVDVHGVATKGSAQNHGEWVTSYKVKVSRDSQAWHDVDGGSTFAANSNWNEQRQNVFAQPLKTRYVRIYPQNIHAWMSMRAGVLLAPAPLTDGDLLHSTEGNTKVSSVYSNDSFSADSGYFCPAIDSAQAWSALKNDKKQWLHFDLGAPTPVKGVVLQGRKNADQWVESLKISTSLDGKKWVRVDNGGAFLANDDRSTKKELLFDEQYEARYVRLQPVEWHGHISLRAAVLIGDDDAMAEGDEHSTPLFARASDLKLRAELLVAGLEAQEEGALELLEEEMCPITYEAFVDPVTTADGQNYEREAIEDWFAKGYKTSPMTNLPLPNLSLTPNLALRKIKGQGHRVSLPGWALQRLPDGALLELGRVCALRELFFVLTEQERIALGERLKYEVAVLKCRCPTLLVGYLGLELDEEMFGRLIEQYDATQSLDLTGQEIDDLSLEALAELAGCCPQLRTITMHAGADVGAQFTISKHEDKLEARGIDLKNSLHQARIATFRVIAAACPAFATMTSRAERSSDCTQLEAWAAPEVTGEDVTMMVKPNERPRELALQQEIMHVSGTVPCFRCDGTGAIQERLAGTTSRKFGAEHKLEEPQPAIWLFEQDLRLQDCGGSGGGGGGGGGALRTSSSATGWTIYDDATCAALEAAWQEGLAAQLDMLSSDELEKSSSDPLNYGALAGGDEAAACVFGSLRIVLNRVTFEVDLNAMAQTIVQTSSVRDRQLLGQTTRVQRRMSGRETPRPGMAAVAEGGAAPQPHKVGRTETEQAMRTPSGLLQCWVCEGSGRTSKWLAGFEAVNEEEPVNEEAMLCRVCFCDSEFGLSTECSHYYCRECIVGSLEAVVDTAQFPAQCPQCRVEQESVAEKERTGWIEGSALGFLAQREVITADFQFRFMKEQNRIAANSDDKKYFTCPAKCGRFLLEAKPSYKNMSYEGQSMRLMQMALCPCGTCLCPRCHKVQNRSAHCHVSRPPHCHASLPQRAHRLTRVTAHKVENGSSFEHRCPHSATCRSHSRPQTDTWHLHMHSGGERLIVRAPLPGRADPALRGGPGHAGHDAEDGEEGELLVMHVLKLSFLLLLTVNPNPCQCPKCGNFIQKDRCIRIPMCCCELLLPPVWLPAPPAALCVPEVNPCCSYCRTAAATS